jgi:hypothetical protein
MKARTTRLSPAELTAQEVLNLIEINNDLLAPERRPILRDQATPCQATTYPLTLRVSSSYTGMVNALLPFRLEPFPYGVQCFRCTRVRNPVQARRSYG